MPSNTSNNSFTNSLNALDFDINRFLISIYFFIIFLLKFCETSPMYICHSIYKCIKVRLLYQLSSLHQSLFDFEVNTFKFPDCEVVLVKE